MKELNHIAIILDGNGRWAKKRGLPRKMGHVQGAKNVEKTCRLCHKKGIKYLTIYAFSTENWKRPEDEVKAIMGLFDSYLDSCIRTSKKDNMRVRLLGDRSGLTQLLPKIEKLEDVSKDNTGLNLQICINYGSRNEILRGVKSIAKRVEEGEVTAEEITDEMISDSLDTAGIPDPDLMIRTSGEQRLSNYLLWQLAYAEFYFTPVAWPDFDEKELDLAIDTYYHRDRRFGGVKEE
ncbi:MAG: isoprenyl transferase [Lachnospiraceae bacterium]|nr:isoprenyl transferase [Lachnospiraceae bacterium]